MLLSPLFKYTSTGGVRQENRDSADKQKDEAERVDPVRNPHHCQVPGRAGATSAVSAIKVEFAVPAITRLRLLPGTAAIIA